MPRKAKITAMPIDAQPDQTVEQVAQEEPKTEAEQMTDVINEVNVTESTLSNEDESSVAPAVQTAPKAKARRVSKKESVFTEPEVEVTSSFDEVQADVVLPKQETYVEPKVACPDCGKKMAAKTLKYSHGPNCVINKQKQSQEDNATQLAEEVGPPEEIGESRANTLLQHHVQTRARAERATRREAMVANLMKNAF